MRLTCNADVRQFVPSMSSALFQGNGIDTRPSVQGNVAFQLYTEGSRPVLEPVHR
ncbi:hypothetical protein SCLCIDRAFT_1213577 [Scleroderma citrinum Foug A]|uniref:Uncharacterized protein n=1 Tax=Scleroderma citrinum Foug A TaxID=1036808 RepID=A0A0C3E857_9AGAM|nr:hypothetical protein SCLCIDRAFT_1213577 [Scleroderma citrinum Foug A]